MVLAYCPIFRRQFLFLVFPQDFLFFKALCKSFPNTVTVSPYSMTFSFFSFSFKLYLLITNNLEVHLSRAPNIKIVRYPPSSHFHYYIYNHFSTARSLHPIPLFHHCYSLHCWYYSNSLKTTVLFYANNLL